MTKHWYTNLLIPCLTLLAALVAGLLAPFYGRLVLLGLFGIAVITITLFYLPELPLAVLVSGMSLWTLLPEEIARSFSGFSILVTTALAFISLIVYRISKGGRLTLPRLALADVGLALFTIWLAIGISYSPVQSYGNFKLIGFFSYSIAGYIVIRFGLHPDYFNFKRLAWIMVVLGLFNTYFSIQISQTTGIWDPTQTATSDAAVLTKELNINVIDHVDYLGMSLIAGLALFSTSRWSQILILIPILAIEGWAFLTFQQRGASLAIIGSLLIYFYAIQSGFVRLQKIYNKWRWFFYIILFVLLSFTLININPQFQSIYLQQDSSVINRFALFNTAIKDFSENPLVGVGTGGMGINYRSGFIRSYAHNRFLEIAAENGIIGLIFVSIFLVGIIIVFTRRSKSINPVLIFAISLAISGVAYRIIQGMFSGDMVNWNIGVWAGVVVSVGEYFNTDITQMSKNIFQP